MDSCAACVTGFWKLPSVSHSPDLSLCNHIWTHKDIRPLAGFLFAIQPLSFVVARIRFIRMSQYLSTSFELISFYFLEAFRPRNEKPHFI